MLPFEFEATETLQGGYCSNVYANATHVLKVPFQGEEMTSGLAAALAMSGSIGPEVTQWDSPSGALVMQRIHPGSHLSQSRLTEAERNAIFIQHVFAIQALPKISGLMPLDEFVTDASSLRSSLLESSPNPVFLHGDLHHENILDGGDGRWVVIDPKGLWGDPCFEAAAWLRKPIDHTLTDSQLLSQMETRLDLFESTLGWSSWRMVAWAYLQLCEGDEPHRDHCWARLKAICEKWLDRSSD